MSGVVVGLDLSLTKTGVAVAGDEVAYTDTIDGTAYTKVVGDALGDRVARLAYITAQVGGWCTGQPDLVVMEGLAYASRTGLASERAGLWWLVARRLIGSGYPVAVVPPTTRAKYATGKGNAGKDAVLLAVARRYPDVEIADNNEADALVLAAMGARRLGYPIDDMPAKHVEALAGVAWPDGWEDA